MKTLLLAAVLVLSIPAHAVELVGAAPNKLGGKMMIYATPCTAKEKGGLQTVSTDDGGRVILTGCALSENELQFSIAWSTGDMSIFEWDEWIWFKSKKAKKAAPAKPQFAY